MVLRLRLGLGLGLRLGLGLGLGLGLRLGFGDPAYGRGNKADVTLEINYVRGRVRDGVN